MTRLYHISRGRSGPLIFWSSLVHFHQNSYFYSYSDPYILLLLQVSRNPPISEYFAMFPLLPLSIFRNSVLIDTISKTSL